MELFCGLGDNKYLAGMSRLFSNHVSLDIACQWIQVNESGYVCSTMYRMTEVGFTISIKLSAISKYEVK